MRRALLARLLPAHKEQATRIARNAAQFLIDQSRPAGDPLAFFPPTYYKDLIASKRTENQNKTMTMEAASAGHAFLDLYDLTGDKTYYDRALGIADTYVRLQREDGSLPIKGRFRHRRTGQRRLRHAAPPAALFPASQSRLRRGNLRRSAGRRRAVDARRGDPQFRHDGTVRRRDGPGPATPTKT